MWAFVLQQRTLPFSKLQNNRPPKLRVQQTRTLMTVKLQRDGKRTVALWVRSLLIGTQQLHMSQYPKPVPIWWNHNVLSELKT